MAGASLTNPFFRFQDYMRTCQTPCEADICWNRISPRKLLELVETVEYPSDENKG